MTDKELLFAPRRPIPDWRGMMGVQGEEGAELLHLGNPEALRAGDQGYVAAE